MNLPSVSTSCELVIAEIPGTVIDVEFGEESGYQELVFRSAT